MNVASLRLHLHMGECTSQGQKQRMLRAIIAKLHRSFNVSLAEAEVLPSPVDAGLCVVAVGRTRAETRDVLERVVDALRSHPHVELTDPILMKDL